MRLTQNKLTTPYRESIKKQSYASDPEQTPPQDDFMGYATDEDAIDAIFKRAAEETQRLTVNPSRSNPMRLTQNKLHRKTISWAMRQTKMQLMPSSSAQQRKQRKQDYRENTREK